MIKTYAIIGRGPLNEAIIQWKQKNLTQGKWGSKDQVEALFSFVNEQQVTFLFAGLIDERLLHKPLNKNTKQTKLDAFCETVLKISMRYNIPPLKMAIEDMVCIGDSNNCIALRLSLSKNFVKEYHETLRAAVNKLKIFPEIVDRFPFQVHLTLGFKRMDAKTFQEFKLEMARIYKLQNTDKERAEIKKHLIYVINTSYSQIHPILKTDLIRMGFNEEKLNLIQKNLQVSKEELESLKADFMSKPFAKSSFHITKLIGNEMSSLTDKELFSAETDVPIIRFSSKKNVSFQENDKKADSTINVKLKVI